MLKLFCFVVVAIVCCAHNCRADLISGWDFQTTTTGGTALAVAPNTPSVLNANFGAGTIFLNGTNGASNWVWTTSGNEVTSFGGTAVNAGTGFSTTTTGSASLALLNSTANGKSLTFAFSMSGFKDLSVSYATQRTATGFDNQTWAFSTDGTNFTNLQVVSSIPSAFAAQTLNTTGLLDDVSSAYLRLTMTGATSGSGNNRLDNIQINATSISAVPEPTSIALLSVVGFTGLLATYRRRKTNESAVIRAAKVSGI